MDVDKPITVVNFPPVRFIGGTTSHGRTVSIHVSWYPEKSVSVITTVGVPAEQSLAYIGMKTKNVVIHMNCDGEALWVKSLV